MKVAIFYGSSTGTCESLASKIAEKFETSDVFSASELTEDKIAEYDLLVLGSSTWGDGDLQDDWYDGVAVLSTVDLSGKKVALFACGDCACYPDTFCGAMKHLYNACEGAEILGTGISTDGYDFGDSEAVIDGAWIGCALDEMNEPEKTDERIDTWVAKVKSEL